MERVNSRKTYSEIFEILNILGKEAIDMLPHKLYILIEENRDKEYKPNLFGENGLIDENKISKETLALFAVLNLKYFVQDEEKNELLKIYKKNEENYQLELHEKYNPDNIFKNRNYIYANDTTILNNQESVMLIKYEENKWYKKIFNVIKKLFKKN